MLVGEPYVKNTELVRERIQEAERRVVVIRCLEMIREESIACELVFFSCHIGDAQAA